MNQTDKSFIKRTDERQTWKQRKKRNVGLFLFPHLLCVRSLSSFLLVCQSICICLSTNKTDRDGRDLWIIILCSPCDTEKLIGSQMGRWVCLCVRERKDLKNTSLYIYIYCYIYISSKCFSASFSKHTCSNSMYERVCFFVCIYCILYVCFDRHSRGCFSACMCFSFPLCRD